MRQWFIILLTFNLFTDFLDGYLARKLNQQTAIGARLDSWADAGTYLLAFVGLFKFEWAFGTALANRKKDVDIQKARWVKFVVFICIVIVFTFCILYFRKGLIMLSALVFIIGAYELWKVSKCSSTRKLNQLNYVLIWIFYVWVGYSFLQMVHSFPHYYILLIFITVFTFDGYSQVVGQNWGKRPLFPRTSPNKTFEGFIGGTLAAVITCLVIGKLEPLRLATITTLILGMAIAFLALWGDFLASKYKRLHQVKEYSQLLPGQGGFLDRFDSWIFTGAVFYWLSTLFYLF